MPVLQRAVRAVPVPELQQTAVFRSRAVPRRTPLSCPVLCAVHSPFWGQKPVIVLYNTGDMLSVGVFGQKKTWQKSALEIIISPQNQFRHLSTPHRQKVESGTARFYVQHHGLTPFVKDPRLIVISTPVVR